MILDIFGSIHSVFPDLLTFEFFGPFFLRVTLGAIIVYGGVAHAKESKRWHAIIELFLGTLLIIGLFTQVVALIVLVITLFLIATNMRNQSTNGSSLTLFYLLAIGVLLSLLVLGPGIYAIDLPL